MRILAFTYILVGLSAFCSVSWFWTARLLYPDKVYSNWISRYQPGVWEVKEFTNENGVENCEELSISLPDGCYIALKGITFEGNRVHADTGKVLLKPANIKAHSSFVREFFFEINKLVIYLENQEIELEKIKAETVYGGGLYFQCEQGTGFYWSPGAYSFQLSFLGN